MVAFSMVANSAGRWRAGRVTPAAAGLLMGALLLGASGGCSYPAPPPPAGQADTAQPDRATFPRQAADSGASQAAGQAGPAGAVAGQGALGRELYARHCAACHGAEGDGNGVAAAYLFPKPRNLQAGRFRLISTANNVPLREDLAAVLVRGMPGSSMPPWGHLSGEEREALVDEVSRLRAVGARSSYVRILKEQDELTDEEVAADDVQREIQDYVQRFTTPGESTVVPEITPLTEAGLARAKVSYATFGCLQCHGQDGRGDGVQKMVDDEGFPTAPRDFTAGVFKGGADPASLYRRIAYGMPGTPMPGSRLMTPEQMVELVHFIRSMSTEEQRQAAVLNRETIAVARVAALPQGAEESGWAGVPAATIRMTPIWWRNNADPGLQVQAVHDGQSIAVRLSWRDDTPDQHAAQGESFEDAVALELYRGDAEPFLGMGDPRTPLDVWFWDADRQQPADVEQQYPRVVVDIYPFSEQRVDTAEFQRGGTARGEQPAISLPAAAAGNPIVPGGATSGASNLAVGGPGSVTFRMPRSQLVAAQGDWRDGRWTVVMTRPLALSSPADGVPLEPGARASVALAVWDGSSQDRDGKKLISIWQDLTLAE